MASRILTCLLFILTAQVFHADAQCNNTPLQLSAGAGYATLESVNYPDPYGPNLECVYRITPLAGMAVHVMSVDVDLYNGDKKCEDKIQFHNEGTADPLKTVCGSDMFFVQSNQDTNLLLNFTSNGVRNGKGFNLKYWSAPSYDSSCTPGQRKVIEVPSTPVSLHLPHDNNLSGESSEDCEYVFRSTQAGNMVILQINGWDDISSLACGKGSLTVYDGEGRTGTKVIDNACGDEKPFMFLDSSEQAVTLVIQSTATAEMKGKFQLKALSISMTIPSCDGLSPLTIGPNPTYIWYPNIMASSNYCDKTLLAPGTTGRVVVLNALANKQQVACNAALSFKVQDDSDPRKDVAKICEMGMPTFKTSTSDFYLDAQGTDRVLLRITSFESSYNGMPATTTANNDSVSVWEKKDFQRNSDFVHIFEAANEEDIVNIDIESTLEDTNDCVSVFNGANRVAAERSFYECGSFKMTRVAGEKSQMRIEVMTDHQKTDGKVKVSYFSIRNGGGCPEVHNILAKTEKVELTSPNWPSEYPLNTECTWRFVSYRPDFVPVVEVIESDLPENCDDYGFVHDGANMEAKRLGEWCGDRKPVYRGSGQVLSLKFKSDGMGKLGKSGFKFRYYADNKVHRELDPGTDVLLIAGIFSIIIVVGGLIFITYRCCLMRRKKAAEDKQPLTQ